MLDKNKLRKAIQHEVGHYIAFRALDIVPKRIEIFIIPDAIKEGDLVEDGIIGATIIPVDNFFFDTVEDFSNYSFAQCVSLAAGTFAETLDFSTRTLDSELAYECFMNSPMCEKDRMFFMEHLPYFIASNLEEFEKSNLTFDQNRNKTILKIMNRVYEIIIDNYEIIEKLTEHIFQKVESGVFKFSFSDFNNIDYICEKFGNFRPGIFVTTSEAIK